MKLNEVSGELLPRTQFPKAQALAKHFVKTVMQRFGNDDATFNPEVQTKQMAANFYKAIVQEIDKELQIHKMKRVREPSVNRKV